MGNFVDYLASNCLIYFTGFSCWCIAFKRFTIFIYQNLVVLLGFGFIKWKIINAWLGYFTLILGLAAVIMILAISDNFDIFKPLFHLKNVWMLAMGVIILTKGLNVSEK